MKPPNKKAPGANRGDTKETLTTRTLPLCREPRKPEPDDPDVARFNSALAAFFRQLRQQLRRSNES